jgi:hypothetical protein
MEKKVNKPFTVLSIVQLLLLTAAVAWLPIVNLEDGAWSRRMALQLVNRSPSLMPPDQAQVDALFLRITPSRNIALSFRGFQPGIQPDEYIMTNLYYRGNYAVYPRRIFVSPPSQIVNNGHGMATSSDFLDTMVAAELDVQWKLTFSRDGQVVVQPQKVR